MVSKSELEVALQVISAYNKELAENTEKSIVVFFDLDDGTSYHEIFITKEDFFDRFKDTELDCEGFSWTLWGDGYIKEFNIMHHLIKLKDWV